MTGRRARWLVCLVVVLLLSACAEIPSSGPVVAGASAGPDRALQAIVPGPADGATPAEIVRGFLDANLSPADGYAVARSFLTEHAAARWQPTSGTVVYSGERSLSGVTRSSPDPDLPERANVSVSQVASISATGHFDRVAASRRQVELEVRNVDGQWRISMLPDLTLINETDLDFVFGAYPVYFLDPTSTYLVPDPRWLPNSGLTATRLVTLLLDGPPEWLQPAVRTSFGRAVRLAGPEPVAVSGGVATVELSEQARQAPAQDRALMYAQLLATLRLLPTVENVTVRSNGADLDLDELDLATEPDVGADPYLMVDGQLTVLHGGSISALVPDPVPSGLAVEAIAISFEPESQRRYAAVTEGGEQLYLGRLRDPSGAAVLAGTHLTAPSFDWRGWVWSTETLSDGNLTVVAPDGTLSTVAAPWLDGRRLTSLRVGRSGSLVAVASTDSSGRSELQIASVERAVNGRPVALHRSDPDPSGVGIIAVRDLAWVGPSELVVLGKRNSDAGPRVLTVGVGGAGPSALPALPDSRRIAGGFGVSSVLVGTGSDGLSGLTGTQWAEVDGAAGATAAAFVG